MPVMDAEEVVKGLLERPVAIKGVRQSIPSERGVYAWWTDPGSIHRVPEQPHPEYPEFLLFYVGIAPKRETSSATLRSRVLNQHLGGNTGSSTFRQTLASLLLDAEGFTPEWTTRALLPKVQNRNLTKWQEQHLRLTWALHDKPWKVEDNLIERLQPPLNLASNASHPFHSTLESARKRFRDLARENPRRS